MNQPVHIAITRRIKPGREAEFQAALREFFQTSFANTGVYGAGMLVPAPGTAESQVSLACGQVVLSAFAVGRRGEPVPSPHLRPSDVWRLAVADLAVGGISVLSQAAG